MTVAHTETQILQNFLFSHNILVDFSLKLCIHTVLWLNVCRSTHIHTQRVELLERVNFWRVHSVQRVKNASKQVDWAVLAHIDLVNLAFVTSPLWYKVKHSQIGEVSLFVRNFIVHNVENCLRLHHTALEKDMMETDKQNSISIHDFKSLQKL